VSSVAQHSLNSLTGKYCKDVIFSVEKRSSLTVFRSDIQYGKRFTVLFLV